MVTIRTNAAFKMDLYMKSSGSPVNVSGYQVKIAIGTAGEAPIFSLSSVDNPDIITVGTTDGKISISIPPTYLSKLSVEGTSYQFDSLYKTSASGDPLPLAEFPIKAVKGLVSW